MIVRKDRGIALCLAVSVLSGLGGCTAIDESIKADVTAAPVANPNSPEMLAAKAAEAATSAPTMTQAELAAANPGPAPIIPGTETAAPIPALKVSALSAAAPETAATEALTMVTTPPGVPAQQALTAAAAPIQETLAPAGAANASLQAVTTTTPGATTAAPAPVVLAYAAPLRATALTSFGDPFDISPPGEPEDLSPTPETVGPTRLNALIKKYSKLYEIPEELVHRVVRRESRYNPSAYSKGNYGLMQIRYNTAKAMGYDGPADGLFDAETNIKYAVKYLKGAWVVADNDHDNAVRLYARGYYYDAKRRGLLHLMQ
jgi:soluble lytic murein transglycosylase-like protein